MWGMSPNAFPDVSVIKCSHYGLTGTSMSQVVDRFVFYKMQSSYTHRRCQIQSPQQRRYPQPSIGHPSDIYNSTYSDFVTNVAIQSI